MLLVGYSRRRIETLNECEAVLGLLRERVSVSTLFFAEDDLRHPGLRVYDPEWAEDIFHADQAIGVYSPGLLSLSLDRREFITGQKRFPHSRIELNLYTEVDRQILESLLCELGALFQCEIAVVLPSESFIKEYNVSQLGVGIGLVDVFWVTYLSKGFTEIISPATKSSLFFKRSRNEDNGSTLLVATDTFREFEQLSEDQRVRLREEVGLSLFTAYSFGQKWGKGGQSWAFSPANLIRFLGALTKASISDPFDEQASLVPVYYRRNGQQKSL